MKNSFLQVQLALPKEIPECISRIPKCNSHWNTGTLERDSPYLLISFFFQSYSESYENKNSLDHKWLAGKNPLWFAMEYKSISIYLQCKPISWNMSLTSAVLFFPFKQPWIILTI